MMRAYRYTFGDGSEYWDCYHKGTFVARVYSVAALAILAMERHTTYKEIL